MNIQDANTNICELNLQPKKRARGKNTCANKLLFDDQSVGNNPADVSTFTASKPVALDQLNNINDQENSPPPLIIDTDKETCSSHSIMSDYFPRTEPIGERLPSDQRNAANKTYNYLSNNPTRSPFNENRSVGDDQPNKERPPEENRTPVVNRSTARQCTSNIRLQSSTPRIIVSVDRRRSDSNEDLNHNHRIPIPIRSSHHHQLNNGGLLDEYNDSFSVDSIPKETYEILSRFSEFRRLVKAYNSEKKKCLIWSKDFGRLQASYKQLEENSFPRPPAVALSYLVDLVTQIQQSGGRGDPRTDEQIARDLGESSIFLMGLKDVTPQQTALNLFNHLYPGYEAKVELDSVNNLEVLKPGLLETMLTFAQRSAPGTNYKTQELRDSLSNSIRGARYQWRKLSSSITHAATVLERRNDYDMGVQNEARVNRINEYSTDIMFHSRKNIATIRRSSQRQNNRRLARIQRQIALETVVSNISSLVYQSSETVLTRPSFESIQAVQQDNNKEVDNLSLSMSSGLLNISDVHTNVTESKSSSENNTTSEVQSEENRPSFFLSDSKKVKTAEEVIEDFDSSVKSDEDDDKEKLLVDSDDEELWVDADDGDLFNDNNNSTDHQLTSTEIALALSLLKSRHSLTNTCISNICKLLKLLHVPSSPTDFRHVRSLISNPYQAALFARESLISCPSCHKISSNSTHCTSSTTCISKYKFITNPTINHILHIEPQIRAVLERTDLIIKPRNNESIITDIVDSPFYRKLLCIEQNSFITLLMNSDGAVVKSISRSIWITTFVINELSPSIRFNRENLIIGMISIGSSKPHKEEMQIFLNDLVKELVYLENNGLRYCPINSPSHIDKTVRVYLIAASCDMPARSLLINHTEATGYFGCVHCENINVGEGHTRVFVYDNSNDVELRSNDSYDEAIRLLEQSLGRRRRGSVNSINNGLDGLRGPCALRSLKHFDVYQSFTSDTLHTLYEGVTSRMLQIFLGNVSKKSGISEEMSVKKDIDTVALTFNSMFYPSSTYRIPRDLKHYSIFKANELKIFLLFGYSIFNGILTKERYNHFRCLAFAAHLIEAAKHDQSTYLEMLDLLEEFDKRFESLYTVYLPFLPFLFHKFIENFFHVVLIKK
ncbi:unnamed protein product [Rotaria sp. Silwood2]|nr:unnamed protein product [Rotaria sp. Silwood2]CAF4107478.1 unnamed protein product [Rotaria sp. Silwood2]CAF4412507.1 unnamed protein product [Rotaria sp. Silwood2]